jgi:hypothetical protein
MSEGCSEKRRYAMSAKFRVRLVRLASLLSPLFIWLAVALAADLDVAWLVGKWDATAPSPGGPRYGEDKFQLTVKADGTFEEEILSARGGRLYVVGKWKISGESVVLEGTYQGGPSVIHATKKTITLRRSGDGLEGTRFTHYNNQTLPISFTRGK